MNRPMSWWNGSQLPYTSSDMPMSDIACVLAMIAPWLSTTPRGVPVEPELYWMTATDRAAQRARPRRSRAPFPGRPARPG